MTIARWKAGYIWRREGDSIRTQTDTQPQEVVTYADHCRALAAVWQEAHDLLAREGWDMSREKILRYFEQQAEELRQAPLAAPQKEDG